VASQHDPHGAGAGLERAEHPEKRFRVLIGHSISPLTVGGGAQALSGEQPPHDNDMRRCRVMHALA
jgi:hypothetical protein